MNILASPLRRLAPQRNRLSLGAMVATVLASLVMLLQTEVTSGEPGGPSGAAVSFPVAPAVETQDQTFAIARPPSAPGRAPNVVATDELDLAGRLEAGIASNNATPELARASNPAAGANAPGLEETVAAFSASAPASATAPAPAPAAPNSSAGQQRGDIASQLASAINQQRAANGLSPLSINGALASVAAQRSSDMIGRGYFGHANAIVFDMLRAAGISYTWAGENISRNNYPDSDSVAVAIRDLMASSPHRANILHPNFTQLGVGCLGDGAGMKYCTMVFIG